MGQPLSPEVHFRAVDRALDPLRLRLLVEVERRGSISAAAKTCMISQPSASMHLQTLEAALGHRLLKRNGRRTQLTDAGRMVARRAEKALDALDAMKSDLRSVKHGEIGTVAVAVCGDFANTLLPAVLRQFAAVYPGIDIRVAVYPSRHVFRVVANADVRLGLAGEMPHTSGVRVHSILHDELVCIGSTSLLAARQGNKNLPDLSGLTLLVRGASSSTQLAIERALLRSTHAPEKVCELGSVEAIKQAVRYGFGVGFVSRLTVQDELRRGELVQFNLQRVGLVERPLVLICRDHYQLGAVEQTFVNVIQALLATETNTDLEPVPALRSELALAHH